MRFALIIIVSITFFGCADEQVDHDTTSAVIRIAVLPDQAENRLIAKYEPLVDYLESMTGLDLELSLPESYSDLLEQFEAGRVDLAWFGGLTYVQAAQKSHAAALAFRDIDLEFTSCYLAKATDTRMRVTEFAGESFSFGPDLSTSGHLMPRHFMTEDGLDPEKFFGSVRHSAGHDQTALWVSDGTVTLGVANCIIVRSLFESGELDSDDVRIVETTAPYPDYVWATHTSMSERTRQALLDAFLGLDASNAEHRAILRSQGANAYLPAGLSDFELIRTAAVKAGVLAEDDKR